MKHLKTLITLFLLVIGTGMSWAEFKDFEIDLANAKPDASTPNTIPDLPSGVEQIKYPGYEEKTAYNGNQHGWEWAAFQFKVDGPVKITLGSCCYIFSDAYVGYVTDASGNKLGVINNKMNKCYHEDGSCAAYAYYGGETTLNLYCGQYCPCVKVEKLAVANNCFEIDLRTKFPVIPEGLKQIPYPGNNADFNDPQHGWRFFATEFVVDGPVNITLGTCQFITKGYEGYVTNGDGNKLGDIKNRTEGYCYDPDGTTASYNFTGDPGKYHVLRLYCGEYCPYIKVSVDCEGVKNRITAIGDVEYTRACEARIKSARNAYDALSDDDKVNVTNYNRLLEAEENFNNMKPAAVPERIVVWDWENASSTSKLVQESNKLSIFSIGYIHASDVKVDGESVENAGLSLEVKSIYEAFSAEMSGNLYYGVLSEGSQIKVPIRRAEDVVKIKCTSDENSNYTIGKQSVNSKFYEYTSTQEDADRGYALITATATTNFFSITVVQNEFDDVLPMITLNAAGWASFTSLVKGYTVISPLSTQAYIATAVEEEEGDYGKVVLTPVNKFAYGQGVFIKGDPYAQIYANISKGDETDIPKDHKMTVGCVKDAQLYQGSGAYVMATYKTGTSEAKSGFYRVNADDVIVPAGKAYLFVPKIVGAKELRITFANGEEATGIESVLAGAKTEVPTVFYNLSGQKVDKNYKGIVIGNDGKKYVK